MGGADGLVFQLDGRPHARDATPERTMRQMQHPRLTHPDLDFWIDVRIREFDGRWLAVADLTDTPEIGTGEEPRAALQDALRPFAPRLRDELVDCAEQALRKGQLR